METINFDQYAEDLFERTKAFKSLGVKYGVTGQLKLSPEMQEAKNENDIYEIMLAGEQGTDKRLNFGKAAPLAFPAELQAKGVIKPMEWGRFGSEVESLAETLNLEAYQGKSNWIGAGAVFSDSENPSMAEKLKSKFVRWENSQRVVCLFPSDQALEKVSPDLQKCAAIQSIVHTQTGGEYKAVINDEHNRNVKFKSLAASAFLSEMYGVGNEEYRNHVACSLAIQSAGRGQSQKLDSLESFKAEMSKGLDVANTVAEKHKEATAGMSGPVKEFKTEKELSQATETTTKTTKQIDYSKAAESGLETARKVSKEAGATKAASM